MQVSVGKPKGFRVTTEKEWTHIANPIPPLLQPVTSTTFEVSRDMAEAFRDQTSSRMYMLRDSDLAVPCKGVRGG